MDFTAMLDEYLDARQALAEAKGKYPVENYYRYLPYAEEKDRYDAARVALDGLVARLLQAEESVRLRDAVQPVPTGFP